jgi:hypothetical protein
MLETSYMQRQLPPKGAKGKEAAYESLTSMLQMIRYKQRVCARLAP